MTCSRDRIQSATQLNRKSDLWRLIYLENVGGIQLTLLTQPDFCSPSFIRTWLISSAPSNSLQTNTFHRLWWRRMEAGCFPYREDPPGQSFLNWKGSENPFTNWYLRFHKLPPLSSWINTSQIKNAFHGHFDIILEYSYHGFNIVVHT